MPTKDRARDLKNMYHLDQTLHTRLDPYKKKN